MSVKEWAKLPYHDPLPILIGLREIALTQPLHELPYKVSALRTRELRPFLEGRQSALFSYLVGEAMGVKVRFSPLEKSDYDCITHFERDGYHHLVPVQLKELVPNDLNPTASLQSLINGLIKYRDSSDLVVAVHLNRNVTIRLSELSFDGLNISQLWLYGSAAPDQSTWLLVGDLLDPGARWREIRYPGA
ncbi:hypothetical protein [Lysobacter tyrosinilyticus]